MVRDVGRVLQHALRPGRPAGQADPEQPGQAGDAAARRSSGEPQLQELRDERRGGRALLEIGAEARRALPPRLAPTPPAWSSATARSIELVPLYRDPRSDCLVTQFNMKCVEQAGLVKFDFLGLTTLTIIDGRSKFLQRPRRRASTSDACRWTTPRPTRCWRAATPAACSSSKARACATCCGRCAPTGSRTSSPSSRSTGPARWPTSPTTAGASTAQAVGHAAPRHPATSWRRPTASSSTRSR